jgi:hypothetical protein
VGTYRADERKKGAGGLIAEPKRSHQKLLSNKPGNAESSIQCLSTAVLCLTIALSTLYPFPNFECSYFQGSITGYLVCGWGCGWNKKKLALNLFYSTFQLRTSGQISGTHLSFLCQMETMTLASRGCCRDKKGWYLICTFGQWLHSQVTQILRLLSRHSQGGHLHGRTQVSTIFNAKVFQSPQFQRE